MSSIPKKAKLASNLTSKQYLTDTSRRWQVDEDDTNLKQSRDLCMTMTWVPCARKTLRSTKHLRSTRLLCSQSKTKTTPRVPIRYTTFTFDSQNIIALLRSTCILALLTRGHNSKPTHNLAHVHRRTIPAATGEPEKYTPHQHDIG